MKNICVLVVKVDTEYLLCLIDKNKRQILFC